jgi:glutamyl-tRNA synthetase
VLGADGERLAKRDRAAAIRSIRDAGTSPERVVGEMAFSMGLLDEPRCVRPSELVSSFTWSRVRRTPWRL